MKKRRNRIVGKGRFWVMSFIYKYETYPLYETSQLFVLLINDVCEYNTPYPQPHLTHKKYNDWMWKFI